MPIKNVLNLNVGEYYVLVDKTGIARDVILSQHDKSTECGQLFFHTVKEGELVAVSYPQNFFDDQTCYCEDDLDSDFVFDPDNLLGADFSMQSLVGKVFEEVIRSDDSLLFTTKSGSPIILKHLQECCEKVYLGDITGDLEDLESTEILAAKEVLHQDPEVGTCYFYDIRTRKGSVTLRFMHEHDSNQMYSAKASLCVQ